MEGSIKKVDRDNCVICSNEIEEGEPFEVYGSAINPRYVHEKCRIENENDKLKNNKMENQITIKRKVVTETEVEQTLNMPYWCINKEQDKYFKIESDTPFGTKMVVLCMDGDNVLGGGIDNRFNTDNAKKYIDFPCTEGEFNEALNKAKQILGI